MQLDHVIKKMSGWLKENAKKMEDADINSSYPYVGIEYLRSASRDIKKDVDDYYKKFESDFK